MTDKQKACPGVDNMLSVLHSVSKQGSTVFTQLYSSELYPLSYKKMLSVLFCLLSWIVVLLNVQRVKKNLTPQH